MSNSNSPIFIIGISRSGSKFYQQLLNSHKDICIAPELNFHFPLKDDVRDIILNNKTKSTAYIVDELYKSPLKSSMRDVLSKFTKDELVKLIDESGQCTLKNCFQSILKLYAIKNKKIIYGAKFPVHHSNVNFLYESFPKSRFLFLIRNPINIAHSDIIKKINRINSYNSSFITQNITLLKFIFPFYCAIEWYRLIINYNKTVIKLGHKQVILLRYEDISLDSQTILNQISLLLNKKAETFNLNVIKKVDSSYLMSLPNNVSNVYLKYMDLVLKIILYRTMKKYKYL